jgi:hypothetical protein
MIKSMNWIQTFISGESPANRSTGAATVEIVPYFDFVARGLTFSDSPRGTRLMSLTFGDVIMALPVAGMTIEEAWELDLMHTGLDGMKLCGGLSIIATFQLPSRDLSTGKYGVRLVMRGLKPGPAR